MKHSRILIKSSEKQRKAIRKERINSAGNLKPKTIYEFKKSGNHPVPLKTSKDLIKNLTSRIYNTPKTQEPSIKPLPIENVQKPKPSLHLTMFAMRNTINRNNSPLKSTHKSSRCIQNPICQSKNYVAIDSLIDLCKDLDQGNKKAKIYLSQGFKRIQKQLKDCVEKSESDDDSFDFNLI